MLRMAVTDRWSRWFIFACLMLPAQASAQNAGEVTDNEREDEAKDTLELEEVIVTGTRIARRDFTAPSPIATLEEAALRSSAQPTLEEALNRMPQIIPNQGRTSNNPGTGTSRINLRGLGTNRTLVMLNGRRLAPAGVSNRVDVNAVPQALIERVEIVTGGASTVYGSDAVSGVVNFITRKDFEGLQFEASAYVTEEGDSEIYDGNVSWGYDFENGWGNLALFGGYLERKPSFAGEREISAVPLVDNLRGEIIEFGSPGIPEGLIESPLAELNGELVQVRFTPDGIPEKFVFPDDLYNFAPVNYLQVPLERAYGGSFIEYQLFKNADGYFEFIFTRNEAKQNLAPDPAVLEVEVNLDNPVLTPEARELFEENYTSPEDPNIARFSFQRRLLELGPRILEHNSDNYRMLAGLRGGLSPNWDYDFWASYTKFDGEVLRRNFASLTRFQQGLQVDPETGECFDPSGGCVPINPFGEGNISPEAAEYLRRPRTNVITREQKLVSGFVRGTPFSTWAGPVSVAFGLDWRSDEGDFTRFVDASSTEDPPDAAGSPLVDGKETVWEAYAEALIPLLADTALARRLELEVGGRLSKYDHAGTVDSFKIGGAWEPVDALRFRAMFQRSVRAPDLEEAFETQRVEQGFFAIPSIGLIDPCSASSNPVAGGVADRCIAQGIPADQIGIFEATPNIFADFIRGGNPDLVPETGETWTAGLVYDGLRNWIFSLDYFDLTIEDTIGVPSARGTCFTPENTAGVLCDRIRRDPMSFNVVEVDETTSNLGRRESDGFDFQASYFTDLPSGLALNGAHADLSVDLIWTHLSSLSVQADPVVDPFQCAGTFGIPCTFALTPTIDATTPEDRITTFANYSSGNLDLQLTWRWLSSVNNNAEFVANFFGFPDPIVSIPSVPSKNYFDLAIAYRFSDRFEARLDIANLFDSDPPLMAGALLSNSNNTDASVYDVFGRAYRMTLRLRY